VLAGIRLRDGSAGGSLASRFTESGDCVSADFVTSSNVLRQKQHLIIRGGASVPLVDRTCSTRKKKSLTGPSLWTFDSQSWSIAEWKKG